MDECMRRWERCAGWIDFATALLNVLDTCHEFRFVMVSFMLFCRLDFSLDSLITCHTVAGEFSTPQRYASAGFADCSQWSYRASFIEQWDDNGSAPSIDVSRR